MARLSRLEGNSGGIYAMIALSAVAHFAVFVFLGLSPFDKREMTIYSPPYSVSLVPGEYTGDFGEGGEEGESVVEESTDSFEPVATGGPGTVKEPSKTEKAKDTGGIPVSLGATNPLPQLCPVGTRSIPSIVFE